MDYNEIIKEAQDIINELNVSTAQKAPDGRYLQYVKVFNNGGDKEGAWKKYEKSNALAKKWVKGHNERLLKEISNHIDADGNIKESLEILREAQDIMSNLFEVEYYGANDVEQEQNNKIKRQGKDKNGNKVDLVSVQDELFPYEGNAKEQYNKKIIAKINDMIEGKATLEDLIQLVRNKKTPVKESVVYESLKDIIDKKFSIAKMKLQGTEQGFQGIPNGPSRERDAAIIDYLDNIKNFNHIADLGNKMIEAQRKVKEQRKQEGKPPIDSRTKGERGQDRANIISAEYAGDIKRYLADKKKKEGTNQGYNSSVNKSIRRHQNKVQEGFEGAIELLEAILPIIEGRQEGESIGDFKRRLAGDAAEKAHNNFEKYTKRYMYSDKHDRKHKLKQPSKTTLRNLIKATGNLKAFDKYGSIEMGMEPMSTKEFKSKKWETIKDKMADIRDEDKSSN